MSLAIQSQKIYFIGIHGVSMSGLALILKEMGKEVAGSDKPREEIYGGKDELFERKGIPVFYGFSEKNLDWNPDLVVQSMSFSEFNPEVLEAKQRGIPMIFESELRGMLMEGKIGIAVSGVHGKTTTTALLSYIFTKAELDPTYLIGVNQIPNLGTHAHFGNGEYVIIEADEYKKSHTDNTPKFLDLKPRILIITSLELEHPDMFANVEEMEYQFSVLLNAVPQDGLAVVCSDWPSLRKVLSNTGYPAQTYGFSDDAKWRAYNVREDENGTRFRVEKDGKYFDEFFMLLAGKHNVLNALSCIVVSIHAGISLEKMKDALMNFSGTERRFEVLEHDRITFIDDYAHHPTAIKTTLEAVRARYKNRCVWCVFQPHLASRTYHLLKDFARSFSFCDKVVLTDIFASAREKLSGISSKDLLEETIRYHDDVVYSGDLPSTIEYLRPRIQPGDVVVTMGAGDVVKVRDDLVKQAKN